MFDQVALYGPCWPYLGLYYVGLILSHVGPKVASCWPMLALCWPTNLGQRSGGGPPEVGRGWVGGRGRPPNRRPPARTRAAALWPAPGFKGLRLTAGRRPRKGRQEGMVVVVVVVVVNVVVVC